MSNWRKGAHAYYGLRNDRSKRQMSKIYKGIKKQDLTQIYEEIDKEFEKNTFKKES